MFHYGGFKMSGNHIVSRGAPKPTVLMQACHTGNVEQVKAYLNHPGTDVNMIEPSGNTALTYAFLSKNIEITTLLRNKGANPAIGNTLFIWSQNFKNVKHPTGEVANFRNNVQQLFPGLK